MDKSQRACHRSLSPKLRFGGAIGFVKPWVLFFVRRQNQIRVLNTVVYFFPSIQTHNSELNPGCALPIDQNFSIINRAREQTLDVLFVPPAEYEIVISRVSGRPQIFVNCQPGALLENITKHDLLLDCNEHKSPHTIIQPSQFQSGQFPRVHQHPLTGSHSVAIILLNILKIQPALPTSEMILSMPISPKPDLFPVNIKIP
jgi:hypothetical protein